ncbi:MAG: YmdB family metallophosphoesterase [Kiritimatiellae bacterium]|nr:YmdB family metallophosphoesterase [Kiritimatiellia bacterium]
MKKILMIGDVVGNPGRRILKERLREIRSSLGVCAVVVNAENAAAGSGITVALAKEIFAAGVDVITLGDHTWGQKEFVPTIGQLENAVRPANYPPSAPGKGWTLVTTPICRFAVLNLLGRVFMNPVDCPFRAADAALNEMPKDVPVFVDFHAEATSEKITLAHYLDGRVTAVVGTHTHVQTSDAVVLPGGTAFQSDLGMTGPWYSSIGRDFNPVLQKFLTGIPARFTVAEGPATLEGAVVTFDPATKKASAIEAFRLREPLA